ncbi:MAG: hypothetical protein RIS43_199, partial [Actinomycetota bacterium]
IASPFGRIDFVWNPDALGTLADGTRVSGAVTHLEFRRGKVSSVAKSPAARMLKKWLAGEIDALLEIPVLQSGTAFKQEVWNVMRLIPAGTVSSYAELAAQTSAPGAVRAAASTCATNSIPLIVPCHRVIRSDGTIGNYALGVKLKSELLLHEGVELL